MQALCAEIFDRSDAPETQVTVSGGDLRAIRFGDQMVRQNLREHAATLSIQMAYRVAGGWKVGVANGSSLSPDALEPLIERARQTALESDRDASYLELPWEGDFESSSESPVPPYDQATARFGPASCINEVARMVLPCHRLGYSCGGVFAVVEGSAAIDFASDVVAVANMNGLFRHYWPTRVGFSAWVATPAGGMGRVAADDHRVSAIDVAALVERAIAEAELPVVEAPSPGAYRALLDAPAVAQLLTGLEPHFQWSLADRGGSAFSNRLGRSIAGENVTLSVDPGHPLLSERPFDSEGWPRRGVTLIAGGALETYLLGRGEAAEIGVSATGHSAPPLHFVLEGNEGTADDLLGELGDGLLVRRLPAAIHFDGDRIVASGLAGSGVLVVQGGALTGVARDVRFRVDVGQLLRGIERLGAPARAGRMAVPPLITGVFEVR